MGRRDTRRGPNSRGRPTRAPTRAASGAPSRRAGRPARSRPEDRRAVRVWMPVRAGAEGPARGRHGKAPAQRSAAPRGSPRPRGRSSRRDRAGAGGPSPSTATAPRREPRGGPGAGPPAGDVGPCTGRPIAAVCVVRAPHPLDRRPRPRARTPPGPSGAGTGAPRPPRRLARASRSSRPECAGGPSGRVRAALRKCSVGTATRRLAEAPDVPQTVGPRRPGPGPPAGARPRRRPGARGPVAERGVPVEGTRPRCAKPKRARASPRLPYPGQECPRRLRGTSRAAQLGSVRHSAARSGIPGARGLRRGPRGPTHHAHTMDGGGLPWRRRSCHRAQGGWTCCPARWPRPMTAGVWST